MVSLLLCGTANIAVRIAKISGLMDKEKFTIPHPKLSSDPLRIHLAL
jgi:hypothetical protein